MKDIQTFAAIFAASAVSPTGGSVLLSNPGIGNGATALLIENTGGTIALVRLPAASTEGPAPFDPALATYHLNAGARLLVTDPVKVGAPYLLVMGSVAVTAGTTDEDLNVNS